MNTCPICGAETAGSICSWCEAEQVDRAIAHADKALHLWRLRENARSHGFLKDDYLRTHRHPDDFKRDRTKGQRK